MVVARKQPYTTPGGRRNVLLLNEGGVLTDRTADYIAGFLDATNDRDVQLVDVNNDTWPDIVTAAACNGCNPAGVADDSRLYLNLGAPGGTWLGFGSPTVLIQGGNNLNAVAAGDVTGDGYVDLYFVSAIDTFEDQLLINGGPANPGIFTVENDRLSIQMRQSNFGTAAVIADMDSDGDNDIVKSENTPVEIFRNSGINGPGQFDFIDPTYFSAGYYVAAGHLDGDSMLDLVIVDDGLDRYILNDGSMIDGQPEQALTFPGSQAGFESRARVADLDGDTWNDVIMASVSVDLPGCDRATAIFRNNADPPAVTFTLDTANIPAPDLLGSFDVAAFDIDGNGTKDLVVGRCTGTQVWMAAPLIAVEFDYPDGLPQFVPPGTPASFQVQLTPINATIEPDTRPCTPRSTAGPSSRRRSIRWAATYTSPAWPSSTAPTGSSSTCPRRSPPARPSSTRRALPPIPMERSARPGPKSSSATRSRVTSPGGRLSTTRR